MVGENVEHQEAFGHFIPLSPPNVPKEDDRASGSLGMRPNIRYDVSDLDASSAISAVDCGLTRTPPGNQIDHGWAWVVIVSSLCLQALSTGTLLTVGVYVVEWINTFGHSRTTMSWIGSMLCGFTYCCGPFSNALCNRFSHRTVIIAGALIMGMGTFLTFFAPDIYTLYFSYGMVTGIGASFVYGPAYMFVGTYFSKFQSLALGLSSVGSGAGAMIFAPFNRYLINQYGWRGAMMITSGILLNGCVLGALLCPAESWVQNRYRNRSTTIRLENHHDKNEEKEGNEGHFSFNDLNITVLPYDKDTYLTITDKKSEVSVQKTFGGLSKCSERFNDNDVEMTGKQSKGETSYLNEQESPAGNISTHDLFDLSLLSDVRQWALIMNMLFWTMSTTVFWVFLVDFARKVGMSDHAAALVVSLISGTGLVTRIFVSLVMLWTSIRPLHLITASALLGGLFTASLPLTSSPTSFLLVCGLMGISIGGLNAALAVVTFELFGVERSTGSFIYQLVGAGVGALIGSPVAGKEPDERPL